MDCTVYSVHGQYVLIFSFKFLLSPWWNSLLSGENKVSVYINQYQISFIFLFPIQCYHEYGNIWSQDCFLHVWETLKYDCSFLSIKCSSCIHSKESFMSATIRMGKITLRLLKKPFAMEWEKERWLCTNMTFLACFCYYLRWKIL